MTPAPSGLTLGAAGLGQPLTAREEIEPYSRHPSELKPYEICPPPTKTRASCMGIGAPNPDKLEAAGLPVPSYEGSGISGGFSPKDLQSAYVLPSEGGEGQTVAIVDAYDDPTAEEDLAVYRSYYGLPECTAKNGCFSKVNQKGEAKNYPEANFGWSIEIALDLDMVSAACPKCHILLVEAEDNLDSNMYPAVEKAAELGAVAISNSWAGEEYPGETLDDHYFEHPGVPALFASGDWGYGVEYPAASAGVVAVGGTSLEKAKETPRGWAESAWSGAGSGCSAYEAKPTWQKDEGCAKRTVADVSAVSDPHTPLSVFIHPGWTLVGGTSAATPILAGVEALSSSAFRAAGAEAFARAGQGAELFDPTEGENGSCGGSYLCRAEAGYDGPTGWGTPGGPLSLPVAVTDGVTVGSESEATLKGSINPQGHATEYHFEYGETTSYGTSLPIPDKSAGSGSKYVEVSQVVKGLKGKTIYHYRITATNSAGTFHGVDRTFGTTPAAATTEAASAVHANDATLNASVNPEGINTGYWFEYGPTTSYGRRAPLNWKDIGAGTEAIAVSATVGFLNGGETYHYRVAAKNSAGIAYGKDVTLTTATAQWAGQRLPKQPLNPIGGPKPYNNSLQSVSCVSQDYCMAVGDYRSFSQQMDSELWNGKEWTAKPMAEPKESSEAIIVDVSCATTRWCVAVGLYSAGSLEEEEGRPLIETWDGSKWSASPVSLPEGIHQRAINGAALVRVSCASARSCMAVGYYPNWMESALIYRWDGEEWSSPVMPTPPRSAGTPPGGGAGGGQFEPRGEVEAGGVSCTSPSWCMVVGGHNEWHRGWNQPVAEIWEGGEWKTVLDESPNPAEEAIAFQGVSCATPSACVALIQRPFWESEAQKGHTASVDRWDGSEWHAESVPVPIGAEHVVLYRASCPSAERCEAAGYSGAAAGSYWPVAYAWNGKEWSLQSTSEPAQAEGGPVTPMGFLAGISCPSPTACLAVGADVGSGEEERGLIERYRPPGPTVRTLAASHLNSTGATLNATVDPEGSATTYQLEYGETTAYGSKVPTAPEGIGSGAESLELSKAVKGLKAGTAYHYRVAASNVEGTTYGEDKRFTTRAPVPSFASSFGELGSAEGKLDEPYGIAVDSSGNLWVADSENNRVEEFGSEGKLLHQIGSKGTGKGQFTEPYALAVGSSGDVWVADTFNNRLVELGPKAEFIKAIGWGVADGKGEFETCESSCLAGTAGSGAGQLDYPYGLTVDGEGDLWVINTWGHQVEEFSSAGAFLGHFSTGEGAFTDIALDSAGDVWLVNYTNHVTKFSPAGELLFSFGATGSGNGQFDFATGIGIDPDGNIWVTDSHNDRIQIFNAEGTYLAQFGTEGSGPGQMKFPRDVAFDPEGEIWVADSENSRIERWTYGPSALTEAASPVGTDGATLRGSVNPQGSEATYWFEYGETSAYGESAPAPAKALEAGSEDVEVTAKIIGLKPQTTYHYRLVAESASGKALGADRTLQTRRLSPSLFLSFGQKGAANGQLTEPTGLAIDSSGNIWVADSANNRIEEFNAKGEYLAKFGTKGAANGQLNMPTGIAIDSSGNLWVADSGNNRVEEFNSKGEYLAKFGTFGSGNGQLAEPTGIAIDSSGNLWVADSGNNRIEEFNAKGEYVTKSGTFGSANGQFNTPRELAIDSSGNLWVPDPGNNRIEEFNAKGEYLAKFGTKGFANGQLSEPIGIAIDSSGNLWVADRNNNRVEEFNAKGEYLGQFGPSAPREGQQNEPWGVALGHEGDIWVTNRGDDRIQKWSFKSHPKVTGGKASSVTTASATINATINPGGVATSYYFEYGPTDSLGTRVPLTSEAIGSGTGDVNVSQAISGLEDESPYCFRAVAESAEARIIGPINCFRTLKAKTPQATTQAANSIGATQATLNATVNPEGSATSYYFEYGTTTSYGTKIPTSPASAGSGTSNVAVSQTPTGLAATTTYHYRVVAESAGGTAQGADKTLTTFKLPKATTEAASSVGATQATLNATVNPEGLGTFYYFEYGTTTSYESKIPAFAHWIGGGTSPIAVSQTPIGLSPGTLYHYRIVAEGYGTTKGEDKVFTTSARLAFASVFGSVGTGNGQFESPMDVAVDSAGNFWVADLHRVQKFNSKGEYLSQFGSSGSGNGQFEYLTGIALDSEGNIWTVDRGSWPKNSTRAQKFNSQGEYQSQFGSNGSGNGQFTAPQDIAVDPSGNIWIADTGNNRIQEFTAKGEYLRKAGSSGSGNGEFQFVDGIATDSEGAVWTVDGQKNRAQKFNSKGEYLSQFGSVGSGNGQFSWPSDISVDSEGRLWIAEDGDRIQGFNSKGEYLTQFGSPGYGAGRFQYPDGIAAGPHHEIYVADSGNGRIQKLLMPPAAPSAITQEITNIHATAATLNGTVTPDGLSTTYQFEYGKTTAYGSKAPSSGKAIGSATGAVAVEQQVTGLEAGTTYHYRVVATNEEGTTYGFDRTFKTAVEPYGFARAFGSNGVGIGEFTDLNALTVDSLGDIWVIDSGNPWRADPDRIEKFNSKGEYLMQVGSSGSANGQFSHPSSITADPSQNIWIADLENHRIQELNSAGQYLRKIELESTLGEEEEEYWPVPTLSTDAAGNLWMADAKSEKVSKYSSTGQLLSEFSTSGHVTSAIGISVDASGNLWIADGANRIVKFNSKGEYQSQFGSYGSGNGQFKGPSGVDVDAEGNIWVSDAGNNRIQEFSSAGTYQRQFGSYGYATGQLDAPSGLALDPEGDVWVVDKNNSRVQEWRRQLPGAVTNQSGPGEEEEFPHILNATVNPHGRETTYQLEYGTTTSYGSKVPSSPANAGSGDQAVEVGADPEGLKSGTTYHYRVVATNDAGTSYGKDVAFVAP